MDLHVGAGARTTVRMRQRQELRRRNLAIGAAVATPGVIIGIWAVSFGGLVPGGDTSQPTRARVVAQVEQAPEQSAADAQPGPGEQAGEAGPTADLSAADQLTAEPPPGGGSASAVRLTGNGGAQPVTLATSPSLGENSGPATARNAPSVQPIVAAQTTGQVSAATTSQTTSTQTTSTTSPTTSQTTTAPESTGSTSTGTPHTHPWDPPASSSASTSSSSASDTGTASPSESASETGSPTPSDTPSSSGSPVEESQSASASPQPSPSAG